ASHATLPNFSHAVLPLPRNVPPTAIAERVASAGNWLPVGRLRVAHSRTGIPAAGASTWRGGASYLDPRHRRPATIRDRRPRSRRSRPQPGSGRQRLVYFL